MKLRILLAALLCAAMPLHAQTVGRTGASVPYNSGSAVSLAWTAGTTAYQGDLYTYGGCSYLDTAPGANTSTPAAGSSWTLLGCGASGSVATTSQAGSVTLAPGASATLSKAGSTGMAGDAISSGTEAGRVVYQKSTWTDLSDFTVDTANVTASIVSGKIQLTGQQGNLTGYIALNATNAMDEDVDFEVVFISSSTPGAVSPTIVNGVSVGKLATGTTSGPSSLAGWMDLHDSPSQLYWLAGAGTNPNDVGTAVPTGTIAAGDLIRLVFSQRGNVFTTTMDDFTQGTHVVDTFAPPLGPSSYAINFPDIAKLAFWEHGGTVTIQSMRVVSRAPYAPNVMVLGDSKSFGYGAGLLSQRFPSLIDSLGPVAVFAGQGDKTADVLAEMPYILADKPRYVLLCIGYNDIAQGVALSTAESNYSSIVSQLQAAGIVVINLLSPPSNAGVNMGPFDAWVSGLANPTIGMPSGWNNSLDLAPDNIHPDAAGHALEAATILNAGDILPAPGAFDGEPNVLPSALYPNPFTTAPAGVVAQTQSGSTFLNCTSASCSPAATIRLVYATSGAATTVNLPAAPKSDTQAALMTIEAFPNGTSLTLAVPASWVLATTSGSTANGTLSIAAGHSVTVASYFPTSGEANGTWLVVGSN